MGVFRYCLKCEKLIEIDKWETHIEKKVKSKKIKYKIIKKFDKPDEIINKLIKSIGKRKKRR